MRKAMGFVILLVTWLYGCTHISQSTSAPSPTFMLTQAFSYTPSATIHRSTTPLPPSTPIPTPLSPTPTSSPQVVVCSPLEGVALNELPQIVTNAFAPPLPGRDDGHHGVDLAFYRNGNQVGMLGLPVLSVLQGTVAATIKDRPPYGNMLIIETQLDSVPPGWGETLQLPTLIPTVIPPNLTCPKQAAFADLVVDHRSLYLLYAHLN